MRRTDRQRGSLVVEVKYGKREGRRTDLQGRLVLGGPWILIVVLILAALAAFIAR